MVSINPSALALIGFTTVVGAIAGFTLVGLAVGLGLVVLAEFVR